MDPGQLVGRTLAGRYAVRRLIAVGGMGVVFEAENTAIGKRVALKLLSEDLAAAPKHVERFRDEARAAAAIGHPGIVDVLDFGREEPDLVFLVMELLEGRSLDLVLESEERLEVPRAVDIAVQVLDALAAAHRQDIVHLDVTPANIFLVSGPVPGRTRAASAPASGERVKLLDFGIARLGGAAAGPDSMGTTPIRDLWKTRTRAILGNPRYMAHEQVRRAGAVDRRTDVYAVGAVLYHMLAGRPPIDGRTPDEVEDRLLRGERPRPLGRVRREVPQRVAEAVDRALLKDPAARFPDAETFADALAPALSPPATAAGERPAARPARRSRTKVAVVAAVVALLAAGLGYTLVAVFGGEEPGPVAAPADASASGAPTVAPSSERPGTGSPSPGGDARESAGPPGSSPSTPDAPASATDAGEALADGPAEAPADDGGMPRKRDAGRGAGEAGVPDWADDAVSGAQAAPFPAVSPRDGGPSELVHGLYEAMRQRLQDATTGPR
jgi:serine/threonine-protein kinase